MTPWIYNDVEFTSDMIDDNIGFVYLITNLNNNKKYIGKKIFFNRKTIYTQKNKIKKKKRVIVESDWKIYHGSNQTLLTDLLNDGNLNIVREIKYLCKSKSECSYFEAKLQFDNDAILSNDFYNDWISVKITRKHLTKVNRGYYGLQ